MINWHIEQRAIADLEAHPKNPRAFTKKGLSDLTKSVERFGLAEPIVVNTDGLVIGGHARLEVLRSQGAKECDCYVPDRKLTAKECDELNIRLNANIAGEWDFDILANEWDAGELTEWGMDVDIKPDVSDVDAEPQMDRAEELRAEWGVVRGQLWKLGEHRLLCGDSTDAADVLIALDNSRCDIVFTSPPYGAANSAALRDHYVPGKKKRESYYIDHADKPGEWMHLMNGWWNAVWGCVDAVVCNVQMISDNKRDLFRWMSDRVDYMADVLIWDKTSGAPQMAKNVVSNAYEFIIVYGGNGSRVIPFADFHGNIQNVVRIDPRGRNDNADVHAAVMPIELPLWVLRDLMANCTTVCEPFCGSGTTIIACEQLGRKCRAIEISPAYVAVALQRYFDATGVKPELIHA